MNYLDELLALYPSQDALGQRYLLAHLSDLPLGLDADPLLEFLWRETASSTVTLAHLARRELGRVLPAALRQAHGLEEGRMGVWSTYQLGSGVQPLAEQIAAEDETTGARLRGAAWHALAPLLERAIRLVRSPSARVWQAASLVAGRFHTRSSLDALIAALKERAAGGGAGFALACALSELPDAAGQQAVLEAARTHGARQSDLLMLLADQPIERTLPVLEELSSRADSHGHCAIAQALVGDATFAGRDLLGRLLARRKGWVTAYALDAVASAPRPEDLPLAWTEYQQERHDFVRVQAVKLIGALPSSETVPMLERILAEAPPRVQAAALEGLARQRADVRGLIPALLPLLESPTLRLRVNAMLLLGRREPEPVRVALESLLFSEEKMHRVEAAFVMGYLRSESSAALLEALAHDDRAAPVRVQAVKSLAKQEGDLAVPRLAGMLHVADAKLVALTARALCAVEDAALPGAIAVLEAAARAVKTPATRGLLVRALGMAASRRGADAPAALLEALEDTAQPALLGALEGAKALASTAAAPRLRALLSHDEPRVRHRAAVAAFLSGELSAIEPVRELLDSPDEKLVLAGLNALLEIAILLPVALPIPRFANLRKSLDTHASGGSVEAFVRDEKPVAAGPAPDRAPRLPSRAPLPATQFEPVPSAKLDLTPARERLRAAPPAPPAPSGVDELSVENVELVSYLVGLARLSPAWKTFLHTYRALIAIPVVLLIPVFMTMRRMDAADAEVGQTARALKPPQGALKAADVRGKVDCAGKTTAPLALRQIVGPGDRITAGPDSRVLLGDGHGNTLFLGEDSTVTIGVPKSDATSSTTPFVFTAPEGDIFVDFRKAAAVELVASSVRIQSTGGVFRYRSFGTDRRLAVASGDVWIITPAGAPQKVTKDQEVAIP